MRFELCRGTESCSCKWCVKQMRRREIGGDGCILRQIEIDDAVCQWLREQLGDDEKGERG